MDAAKNVPAHQHEERIQTTITLAYKMKPFRGTLIIISVLGSVLIQDPSCLRVPESLSTGLVDPEHSS